MKLEHLGLAALLALSSATAPATTDGRGGGSGPDPANQLVSNGLTYNALSMNALSVNGLSRNGLMLRNGLGLNGLHLNGLQLNGLHLNGQHVNGWRLDDPAGDRPVATGAQPGHVTSAFGGLRLLASAALAR